MINGLLFPDRLASDDDVANLIETGQEEILRYKRREDKED